MTTAGWILLALAAWTLWAICCAWLTGGPREGLVGGLVWRSIQIYGRLVHNLRIEGRHLIPDRDAGPLVVVCNHTAGVDPVLIQAACPFEVRWMMALDMKTRRWGFVWDWARVIFVDRAGGDAVGARAAIRHLREGGVLGIFPEGRIERPQRRLLPFQPGVGMVIRRTGADALLVAVEGTPEMPTAWGSLWIASRARVRFLERVSYAGTKLGAAEIAADLRRRFAARTGWETTDDAAPPAEAPEATTEAAVARRAAV
ncbi:MAG: lysophospholipid acyltransferase family protein [Phycisphaerales bacterium JB039]